jgi:hypothetical protein
VYVYQGLQWALETVLRPSSVVAAMGGGFGQSLSIYEDVIGTSYNYVLAVGAPQNSTVYVYFFDANVNAWSQTSQLVGASDSSFGMSVAAFETVVAVGAPEANSNTGSVTIYKSNTQNEWIEQATVTKSKILRRCLLVMFMILSLALDWSH